jgi:hypothetical protein
MNINFKIRRWKIMGGKHMEKAIFWKIVSCIRLCALIIGGADRLSI